MSFDPTLAYEIARQFEAAQSISAFWQVLIKHRDFFHTFPVHPQQHWIALQDSGLIEMLLARVSEPHEYKRHHCSGMVTLHACLTNYPTMDSTRLQFISTHIPHILHLSLLTLEGLEKANLQAPVQPVAVMRSDFQESTVQFIARLFSEPQVQRIIFETVDKEAFIRLVFAVLFNTHDPANTMNGRQKVIRWCTYALAPKAFVSYAVENNGNLSSMQAAVARYGPESIARECIAIWNNRTDEYVMAGIYNMFIILLSQHSTNVCQAFLGYGGHCAIARSYFWELRNSSSRFGRLKMTGLVRLLCDAKEHFGLGITSPAVVATSQLLESEDLLSLIANSLLDFERLRKQDTPRWMTRTFMELIREVCAYNPDLMQQCRSEWLRIMQNFTALARSDFHLDDTHDWQDKRPITIECWQLLGAMLDLKYSAEVPTRTNCSWMRCLLWSQEDQTTVEHPDGVSLAKWEMVQCSGCHRVQYCGESCQKRDWANGHRELCGRTSDVRVLSLRSVI